MKVMLVLSCAAAFAWGGIRESREAASSAPAMSVEQERPGCAPTPLAGQEETKAARCSYPGCSNSGYWCSKCWVCRCYSHTCHY